VDLDELPGVGPAIAEKLREAGLNSLEAIAVAIKDNNRRKGSC
jgi:DNA repair protein RadA